MMRGAIMSLTMVAALSASAVAQDVSPVVSEALIDAPVDSVWAAWSSSEGLRSWLAPHAGIDLRVGGLMRTNYDAQGTLGDPGTLNNTILSYEPARMLSIKVSKAPADFPFPGAIREMWTVLYFEPQGMDRTRVRVVSLGFTADERVRADASVL